ncbi:MAG TPA: YihY/virulence factor BrkB family protein [Steroidobacteraceae bacterium]|jgi:membrane protein|nr:YihY/virulence factor BrkB family protein [Steroidobacteraceae bacterium]
MWQRHWDRFEDGLFSGASLGDRLTARVLRAMRYPYAVLRDLLAGQLNLRAMSLVYATLLSIIPAVALSFAILKAFGVHRELEPVIFEFFRPLGAAAHDLTERIMNFADNVRSGLVGSVGFALLLWTLIGTVKKVEDSFNFVWRVQVPRSFARRIAEYVGMLIAGPVLIVVVFGLSKLAFDNSAVRALSELPFVTRLLQAAIEFAPYAIVTALFTVLYIVIPNTRVRLVPALVGALTAGFLWAATGKLFTAMLLYTSRLTLVYAGFAIVIAVLLWTYFGWTILLAGAQLSFYVQNPSYLRLGQKPLRLTNHEKERLALNILYLVGRNHAAGKPPWMLDALCHELGVPGVAVADIIDNLESAGLLVESDDERVFPGRDAGNIRLAEILDVVRRRRSDHSFLRIGGPEAVEHFQRGLDAAWQAQCADLTLKDLIDSK